MGLFACLFQRERYFCNVLCRVGHFGYRGQSKDDLKLLHCKISLCSCKEIFPYVIFFLLSQHEIFPGDSLHCSSVNVSNSLINVLPVDC